MRAPRVLSTVTAVAVAIAVVASPTDASPRAETGGRPASEAASPVVAPAAATSVGLPAATDTTVTFTGHGWGHGRGMGQYGALGYAIDHGWSWTQILDHFYGGTTPGSIGNPTIDVELVARSTSTWAIVAGNDLRANGVEIAGAGLDVVQVQRSGSTYTLLRGTGCESATWTPVGTYEGFVELTVPTQSGYENLVRTCEAGNTMRAYRGSVVARAYGSDPSRMLVANRVSMENYLLGVVPRESPAAWGDIAGGMNALKAQAVAARSYAFAGGNRTSGAKTCDTTSCQVYGGAAEFGWNGSGYARTKILDAANTNTAVAETAGQVRMIGSVVARTEFSSSTGGFTTGGTFPPVVDDGDDVGRNPNHTWTADVSASALATRLGVPGPLRDLRVTARNGNGDWGGRVTQIAYVDANGVRRTLGDPANPVASGERIRTTLGLKSDWFTVAWGATSEAAKVVMALYQDVLGRGVDPSGLATWTEYINRTGDTAGLVRQIATSRERMVNLVSAQYRAALNRSPEPAGRDHWVRYLEGGWGVYALQIAIYGSPESLAVLGRGDVNTWVGKLYESLLGRAAAPSERDYWTNIAAGQGREAVVAAIARSDEATMRRLTVYYRTFLLRDVDPSGRATFLPMMTGRGDFDVPVHLGSSPEYWRRAQTRF